MNCTVSDQPVQADPDVAGIGVLIAFVLSVSLVIGTVIVGYLYESLSETSFTSLDHFILGRLPRMQYNPFNRIYAVLSTVGSSLQTAAPQVFGSRHSHSPPEPASCPSEAKEQRRERVERFVLALSDQQLVTGLAIMIAGHARRYSMSVYHFNIVSSLAWFSSATHLATLGTLREYFIKRPSVRN